MSNVNENVPAWQFNTIPGNANQGAVLMTRSDIGNPPFNQSDFVWKAMEDIIGTANVKLEYSEPENKYRLYKAKGHRDEEGEWSYEWTKYGEFEGLTPEAAEILRVLKYVEYVYDADTPNVLKVVGVKKDGTSEVILNISYTTVADLNEAVTNLTNSINAETNRATLKENQIESDLNSEVLRSTNKDNELENAITQNTPLSGTATELTQTSSGKTINVKVDNNNVKVNNNNELTADVIDDTQTRHDKGWSSSKISQVIHQIGIYKGQVATVADLPSGAVNGDIYKVLADGNYYMWNGTTWDDLESDYVPGQGIDITNKVIGVKIRGSLYLDENNKLGVSAQGPIDATNNGPIRLLTGASTQTSGGALEVKPGNGLEINNNTGLNVKVDGTTIDFDANGNLTAIGGGSVDNIVPVKRISGTDLRTKITTNLPQNTYTLRSGSDISPGVDILDILTLVPSDFTTITPLTVDNYMNYRYFLISSGSRIAISSVVIPSVPVSTYTSGVINITSDVDRTNIISQHFFASGDTGSIQIKMRPNFIIPIPEAHMDPRASAEILKLSVFMKKFTGTSIVANFDPWTYSSSLDDMFIFAVKK